MTGTLPCVSPNTCVNNVCVASAVCGDGQCNGDETCSTCSTDCGSCPTGTVYYISTTGDDSTGTGTSSNPWKTLAKACNSVSATGSTIYVNPGTYTETQQCNLKVGVSILGAGNSSVITSTSITTYGGGGIVKAYSSPTANGAQSISYIKFDGSNFKAGHALDIRGRHNVKIHHCTFTNFNYFAIGWTTKDTTWNEPSSTDYIKGSEFYNNIVINGAGRDANDPGTVLGALMLGGQDGMLIHDNYMLENRTSNQGYPIKFWYWNGWSKGVKIYNNHLEKTSWALWDFAIESNYEKGMEIYDNRIIGSIDLNYQLASSEYPYSVYIHDNVVGPAGPISGWHDSASAIVLEFSSENVLVENNLLVNASPCFMFTPRTGSMNNVTIRYNICQDVMTSGYYIEGLRVVEPSNIQINGFYFYNNIFHGHSASSLGYALSISTAGSGYTGTNMQFKNNVIINFGGGPMRFSTSSINGLYIQNNIFYNSGSNQVSLSGTPSNYTNSGNLVSNPLFVGASTGNFHLQSSSPAINAGLNLGLTSDFERTSVPQGSAPDIGAYEYH
ncbi:MAG TPA: choice-of-anchor Q domain-containing protein, partial [Candidatus Pacearchaeota archaeon]|nr:choice-of-anchor Q domain-containing protein [Candidatus Pacearchaeota archaeon]